MGTLQNIFSARLMELCKSKKTISLIAEDLNINRQQFARYLNNTAIPREATIERIAEYFDVHPTYFFTNTAPDTNTDTDTTPVEASTSVVMAFDILSKIKMLPVTPHELPPGIYTLMKCSFKNNGKLLKSLFQIRYIDGIAHYKALVFNFDGRGYSPHTVKRIINKNKGPDRGLFLKTNGKLILLSAGTSERHTTVHVFLWEHDFDFNIKPGVHMTLASSISSGVRSSTIVLRKLSPDESALQHARTTGWVDKSSISDIELDVLAGGTFENSGIIGV